MACPHTEAYSTGHRTFPSGVPMAKGETNHFCPSCLRHFAAPTKRRRLDPVELGALLRSRKATT